MKELTTIGDQVSEPFERCDEFYRNQGLPAVGKAFSQPCKDRRPGGRQHEFRPAAERKDTARPRLTTTPLRFAAIRLGRGLARLKLSIMLGTQKRAALLPPFPL
ncbi:hypothetical protein NKH72_26180 [Mesorhizobium sp. M0955]|uniref:hypothetical protein n=1 Tax=Mesorhizobium sp. M0955 TaxID=2957033 RepID=UPI0033378036